jgi:hypothetical protein
MGQSNENQPKRRVGKIPDGGWERSGNFRVFLLCLRKQAFQCEVSTVEIDRTL